MKLWTIQTDSVWKQLLKVGTISGSAKYVDPTWLNAYKWLIQQMELTIGKKNEMFFKNAEVFPIWAWYQWADEKHKKPDLRSPGHLNRAEKGVRIECEIPDSDVLLSDFHLWHYVLNYWYLNLNEQEAEAFERDLAKQNLSFYTMKPLPNLNFHHQIVESWQQIFTITTDSTMIQATFWELPLSAVKNVKPFKAK